MFLQQVSLMVVYLASMALGMEMRHVGDSDLSVGGGWGAPEGEKVSSCYEAQQKCAYRSGCSFALTRYFSGCYSVLNDPNPNPSHCPTSCQHALIALTSSDEGKELTQCNCTDNHCREQKKRVEVCRPSVLTATQAESVVSCEVAQWICSSDGQCSTALEYYHKHCKAMFRGKKCSKRCLNSINILMRQEKAKKLNTCICNSRDGVQCWTVQRNMDRLCFNKTRKPCERLESNEIFPLECNSGSSTLVVFTSVALSFFMLLRPISSFLTV